MTGYFYYKGKYRKSHKRNYKKDKKLKHENKTTIKRR